jgi:hypothetical protein
MVLWMADKFHYQTYPEMLHSLKTGQTVVEKVFGASCFGYFEKSKEEGHVFDAAMTTFSKMLTPPVGGLRLFMAEREDACGFGRRSCLSADGDSQKVSGHPRRSIQPGACGDRSAFEYRSRGCNRRVSRPT